MDQDKSKVVFPSSYRDSEKEFNSLDDQTKEFIKKRALKIEAFVDAVQRQEEKEKLSDFRKEIKEKDSNYMSNTKYLEDPDECLMIKNGVEMMMSNMQLHTKRINLDKMTDDEKDDDTISLILLCMEYLDSRNIFVDNFNERFRLMVINYIERDDSRHSLKDKNITHGIHFVLGDPLMIEMNEVKPGAEVYKMVHENNTLVSLRGYWRWYVDGKKIQTGTAGSQLVRKKGSSTVIISFYAFN